MFLNDAKCIAWNAFMGIKRSVKMDYKDLANLIFPNVKDIKYYEEKYPERNLEEGAIVTRFAPSPTGFFFLFIYHSLIKVNFKIL